MMTTFQQLLLTYFILQELITYCDENVYAEDYEKITVSGKKLRLEKDELRSTLSFRFTRIFTESGLSDLSEAPILERPDLTANFPTDWLTENVKTSISNGDVEWLAS